MSRSATRPATRSPYDMPAAFRIAPALSMIVFVWTAMSPCTCVLFAPLRDTSPDIHRLAPDWIAELYGLAGSVLPGGRVTLRSPPFGTAAHSHSHTAPV